MSGLTEGGRRPGTRAAVACSVADQGVAALTNIAVLVIAARQSTAAAFAAFAVVYTVFTVLLGLSTAFVGQALVLERGEAHRVRTACRSALAFTACASALPACLAVAFLAAAPGRPGALVGGLAALGAVLPVLLTHECLRYVFSTLRRSDHALTADLLRLGVAVPALALQPDGSGSARLIVVWGLSGLPALLTGLALARPRLRGADTDALRYLRPGHLGRRFAVEFTVGNAGTQLAVIGLGVLAGPLVVGALRGATTLFGPLNVLFNAATGFGPPLLGRLDGPRRTARAAAGAGALLSAVAVCWAAVLYVLPDRAGRMLLGDTWSSAAHLLPATGSQYAAMAMVTCGLLALRVLRPRATLPIQVVFSLTSVCCLSAGYLAGGVLGAAWGLCLGSGCKAAATWLRVTRLTAGQEPPARPVSGASSAAGPGTS